MQSGLGQRSIKLPSIVFFTNKNISFGCTDVPSQAAVDNYKALKAFFAEFQIFRHHKVFIMGESYAAIYITMLVDEYLRDSTSFHMNIEVYFAFS